MEILWYTRKPVKKCSKFTGGVFKVRTPEIKNQVYVTSTLTARRRSSADEVEGDNANRRKEAAVV
jgi:hypothetical protein